MRVSAVGPGSVTRIGFLVVGGLGAATAVASTAAWGTATLIAPDALPRPGIWLTVSMTLIVLEVVLGSCLAALVGCLYNLTAPYDGGVEISLTDDLGPTPDGAHVRRVMSRARARARRHLRALTRPGGGSG
ncbi:DUF3566 domain-containing protein [Streptomyces sp. NPDC007162]|uniref:DUF3566 domain-containing protein n=1 Tax=Streptomyces sp. NPDC007162 TaxID=3156917 RepID=UPI0033C8ECA6